jgi:hypothetical protein
MTFFNVTMGVWLTRCPELDYFEGDGTCFNLALSMPCALMEEFTGDRGRKCQSGRR